MGHLGRAGRALPVAVGLVAFGLRLRTALADFETYDERTWAILSDGFGHSLASGDLSKMSAVPAGEMPPNLFATLPGVTTMWIGAAARVVWSWGLSLGLWSKQDGVDPEFATFGFEPSALDVAQVLMALVIGALLGVVVWLLAIWVGKVAAGVAGVLLATEPFLVAHGAVLHTDELSWFFGLAGVIAVALFLGIPDPTPWKGRRKMAVFAGLFLAGAFLTKVTAVLLLPGLAFLVAWAGWIAWHERDSEADDASETDWAAVLRPIAKLVGVVAAVFVVAVLVSYPALWTRPGTELGLIQDSASQGGVGHRTFFRGEGTDTPGLIFYFVALPLRVTPWLLCAGLLAAVAAWFRRSTRVIAVILVAVAVTPFVTLTLASKQFDRYAIFVPILAAVLIGVGVSEAWTALRSRSADVGSRWLPAAGAAAAGVLVVNSFVVAPWGLAYFNPLLGGSSRAEKTVLIGWGEGSEKAGPALARLIDGDCDDVVVDHYLSLLNGWKCGDTALPGETADYVVVYIADGQARKEWVTERTAGREFLGEVRIRGIPYLMIYGPRR